MLTAVQGKIPDLKMPSGWIGVNHESGGIVYLHKDSRVVTWSRPYYLGKNSLRVCNKSTLGESQVHT